MTDQARPEMPFLSTTKNAPESVAADIQGHEIRTTTPMKEQESNPMVQNFTDLDQWNSRAEVDHAIDTDALIDTIAARTPWADREYDLISGIPARCGVASAPVSIPLSQHVGVRGSSDLNPAHIDVQIRRRIANVEPLVTLDRWETDAKGKFGSIFGSHCALDLDEAAQLAHALLLAVDVARGISDESVTADQIIAEAKVRGTSASVVLAEYVASRGGDEMTSI